MDSELYHYGVKGMKWGIRRKRPKSVSKKSKTTNRDTSNNSVSDKIKQSVDKGRDFVSRNKKTIALAALSTAFTAAGMGYVGSSIMTSYNIASMDLHNYLIKNDLYRGLH